SRGSNFTNNGTITVSNTGGNGIGIVSFLTNNGTITVSNSGGAGILGGTITNNSGGKITVSNTGGFGIETGPSIVLTNNSGALIAVSNTGNIDNSGTINNTFGGTFTNDGTVTDECGGQYFGPPLAPNQIIVAPCDNDGDGYTSDVDCNDNDPNINPGA